MNTCVRSVSHIVADVFESEIWSSFSFDFTCFDRSCKSGQVFDSQGVIEFHETITCPSVLQVCTPNVLWRLAVDDVQTYLIGSPLDISLPFRFLASGEDYAVET